jgi:hypothetical protein
MIEIAAAAVGAAFTAVVMAVSGAGRRASEGRDAVIRLTAAVENVANRLEELHVDIKADRRETYGRLNAIEQRVAKLEANS